MDNVEKRLLDWLSEEKKTLFTQINGLRGCYFDDNEAEKQDSINAKFEILNARFYELNRIIAFLGIKV